MEGLGFTLYLPNGRIKFQSGLGKKSSSPAFGSVVIEIGNLRNCAGDIVKEFYSDETSKIERITI